MDEPDQESSAGPEGERLLYLQAIEMIRGEFEPTTWEAFWMVTVDGRKPADVAAALGVSRNAVYLARSRVLHRLREEFHELIDPDVRVGTPDPEERE